MRVGIRPVQLNVDANRLPRGGPFKVNATTAAISCICVRGQRWTIVILIDSPVCSDIADIDSTLHSEIFLNSRLAGLPVQDVKHLQYAIILVGDLRWNGPVLLLVLPKLAGLACPSDSVPIGKIFLKIFGRIDRTESRV